MPRALGYLGQAAAYALAAALLGYFSVAPAYQHFPSAMAQVKLSFAHGGKPKGECRKLSPEELKALPPNMRQPEICPRERLPVLVELSVDGDVILFESLPPTGLASDGPSRIYRKFTLEPGEHRIRARLRDSNRAEGFDYERDAMIKLSPQEILVIDFKADQGGFLFL
jgi:hypothetical protein